MASVTIEQPLNHGDPMPDPVMGTINLLFSTDPPEGESAGAGPPPGPAPGATVIVSFVRTDLASPNIDIAAVVSGNAWVATSTTVPGGVYTVVAVGSFGGGDPPGSDSRHSIHK